MISNLAETKQDADITMNGDNDSNEIDSSQAYCTNALIKKVGGAVAVSLEDAVLPGNARNKHMTVLYRKHQRWSDNEIELISKEADNWIKRKYGDNRAPVTFSLAPWGRRSVLINGDLNELCLYLRDKFAALSHDKQRPPHAELFVHEKRGKKHEHGHGHGIKNGTNHITKKGDKMKSRIERIISKTEKLKERKQNELKSLDEQQKLLQAIYDQADDLDAKAVRVEIKNVAKLFKTQRKQFRGEKGVRKMRGGKHAMGKMMKHKKCNMSGGNGNGNGGGKFDKQQKREWKLKRREERKKLKEERKQQKKNKIANLENARIENLPVKRAEIGNMNVLYVYIDGYNIIGCDSICRQSMRGRGKRGGGMKAARDRLIQLVQNNFVHVKRQVPEMEYDVITNVWFDGNGRNEKHGDVFIEFSSKQQSVDDKLVNTFGHNEIAQNANVLVVTSDRELTLRLNKVGVKVMKSGRFYKSFLKNEKNEKNVNDVKETEQKQVEDDNENEMDDDFVNMITAKMESIQFEDSPGNGNGNGDTDGDDSSPEEVEGENDNDEDMSPGNDGEDEEFETVFGEDMDILTDDENDDDDN